MDGKTGNQTMSGADLPRGEAQFRAVFDCAAIGITLVDLTGRPVKCNPALERILGYTETELRAMTFRDFTHPDDLQADLDLYNSLVARERDHYQIEKRYIRKDRQIVWARLTISLVRPQVGADPGFVIGMVEDVTAHKIAQETLRESEEKFSKAFHGNPNPTLITARADGRILEANQAFAEWFGVSIAGARGRTAFEFGIWKSTQDREELLRLLEQDGPIRDYPKAVTLPSGEIRSTLITVQPLFIGREDCLLTLATDLTGQEQAERALRRTEDRLRRALDAARMGAWEWDVANDRVSWVGGVHSLFGLAPGEFAGTSDAFFKLVDPEDLARVRQEVKALFEGSNREYYSEMRVRWPDNSIHWVESRGELRRDANGKPLTMLGTVVDVTERKCAERALRSSEDSLRATVENTPDVAIQWYDEEGRVLLWNRASEIVFGWTADEAAGRTLDQLILDADESARFLKALQQVARTGEPIPPSEYRFRRRDGRDGVCFSTVFQIPRAADKPCFVCMDVDLTGLKQVEESLREAQARELRSREEFTRQLMEAGEQERQRLAAELHDSLGQNLSIIKNNAFLALDQPGLSAAAAEHLKVVSQFTEKAIAEVRDLVHNLRPLQIEQLGLTDSIRELVEKVAQSTPVHMELRIENVDDVIPASSATYLYRIVQEALNNLIKHAHADRAEFRLERDVNCVRVSLADTGRGFEVGQAPLHGGFGLRNISERAQMLGGQLKIESLRGAGTRLTVELPIHEGGGLRT